MYVAGIIPGPKEPHDDELNHYIRPVIDDFLVSWRGVFVIPAPLVILPVEIRALQLRSVCAIFLAPGK